MSTQMICATNTDIDTRHFWVEEADNFLHEMVIITFLDYPFIFLLFVSPLFAT